MEIALVYREIQQLLIKDEVVMLPKVGKFAVVAKSATFLEDCRTILPPKKELVFSPISECGENDVCEQWQQELAEQITIQLQHNGVFEVPGFGVFKQSQAGEVSFELSPEFDFAPDSFSLESIALEISEPEPAPAPAPVAEVSPAPAKEEKITHDVAHHQAQKQKWVLYGLLAMIVVLIAILFIFLFKESFGEMIKNLLYSKEELEIIREWSSR